MAEATSRSLWETLVYPGNASSPLVANSLRCLSSQMLSLRDTPSLTVGQMHPSISFLFQWHELLSWLSLWVWPCDMIGFIRIWENAASVDFSAAQGLPWFTAEFWQFSTRQPRRPLDSSPSNRRHMPGLWWCQWNYEAPWQESELHRGRILGPHSHGHTHAQDTGWF